MARLKPCPFKTKSSHILQCVCPGDGAGNAGRSDAGLTIISPSSVLARTNEGCENLAAACLSKDLSMKAVAAGGLRRRRRHRAFVSMMFVMANLTLVYGLRLLPEGEVTEIQDATLQLANGHKAHVTMHMIDGSREEIEAQLKRSLDAFFDFYPEI